MASLRQQMSLRLSDRHRELIRSKLEELRLLSDGTKQPTEADAARALIEEAGQPGLFRTEVSL